MKEGRIYRAAFFPAVILLTFLAAGCTMPPGFAENAGDNRESPQVEEFKAAAVETEDKSMTITEGTVTEL
nr:hypothetical protein [Lachnospiraceae bacterium]